VIAVQTVGRTRVVTIDRPARRNAVDSVTALALFEAFGAFDADEAVDVAVLTGAGGHFCAGADLQALAAGDRREVITEDAAQGPMGPTRMKLGKPVIAAIEGFAVAGGLELALWCDMRVAGESATLGVFCRRFGVPLIDLGTVRLPRLIGQARAADMILTGRAVGSAEALAWGLVSRVVPDGTAVAEALALAAQISGFPQAALRGDRLSMIEQWGLDDAGAQANEVRHGVRALRQGVEGAGRFAAGAGRHGGAA
jgi:enoyl-CoA hydratase